jgi:hypothetical protein
VELPAKRELGKDIPLKILEGLVAGKRRIFLFGLVRYRDVFDKGHYTKLCASLAWRHVNDSLLATGPTDKPVEIDVEWDIEHHHNDFD